MLKEGYCYDFLIAGEVELPDGYVYFKLRDPNGFQHLLSKDFYRHYNLKPGTTVSCLISRVNCSGQVFLEPVHPFYRNGESYPFRIKKTEGFGTSDTGQPKVLLTDRYDNEFLFPAAAFGENIHEGMQVFCLVERIKRGVPVLCPQKYLEGFDTLESGRDYSFDVTSVMVFGHREEYYILEKSGFHFRLRKKYYRHYGFGPGDSIGCVCIKGNGIPRLEPVHPLFKVGQIYSFEVLEQMQATTSGDVVKDMLVLKNPAGKSIHAEIPAGSVFHLSDRIQGRVTSITFGIPSVEVFP
ncbi:MAG: hypothetical protein JXA03_11150 [Bacteroidales bacterium]|nr:hypothetical protein [Bacteroidales bacterium]